MVSYQVKQFALVIKPNYHVYFLRDPFTNDIKYVGVTGNPHKRLINHISNSFTRPEYAYHFWIQKLSLYNLRPILEIVEDVEYSDRLVVEEFWMRALHNQILNGLGHKNHLGCNSNGKIVDLSSKHFYSKNKPKYRSFYDKS